MLVPQAPFVIFFIITSSHISLCLEKGSLVYVIDTTGSMVDDIAQVKESTNEIIKKVFEEKASQIRNMMIVTFNDPGAALDTITEDRNVYESKLNELTIINKTGEDCPEMSMEGLSIALENSLPGSFIYLFTDASAKDYYKKDNITKMCQEKQSQIVFVLTGHCLKDHWLPPFQVYYEIAAACSGLAINVYKYEVSEIFGALSDAITDRKEEITSKSIPANTIQDITFEIDDQTEYVTITAAGDNVQLLVRGPMAITTWWTYRKKQITWLNNFKVLKLTSLTPGTYMARVKSKSETTIKIVGKSDFTFEYGFSTFRPITLTDTTVQPDANSFTHLLVSVSDPNHSMDILSAQILDINENIIESLTLDRIIENLYATSSFITPSKTFKIAVLGTARNTDTFIRHLGPFPITPLLKKQKPVVTILEGKSVEIEYGQSLILTCKVAAYPEPKIQWVENGSQIAITSEISVMEQVYTSYLTIPEAFENKTYFCKANNEVGNDNRQIEVNIVTFGYNSPLKVPPSITSDSSTLIKSVEGQDKVLRIPCKTIGLPKPTVTWKVRQEIIETSTKYTLEDGALLIKEPTLQDAGTYICEATNDAGNISAYFNIEILQAPQISGVLSQRVKAGTSTIIICNIIKGVPAPTISWQFMAKGESKFVQLLGSDNELRISRIGERDAGLYKCVAHNDVADDEHITELVVEFAPYITTNRSATYKGIEGDVALVMPCDAHGVPTPVIYWLINGNRVKTELPYSILSNGALIIKNPKIKDTGSYTCVATNTIGSAHAIFEAEVKQNIDNYGKIVEVFIDVSQQTSYTLECGSPGQSVTWFTENLRDTIGNGNYYQLNDIEAFSKVNYTCRVSDTHGAYTKTFVVQANTPAKFKFEQQESSFVWPGNDKDFLDCTLSNEYETSVEWTYNGKLISDYKSLTLNVARKWGAYTCNVTTHFGTVQRSFNVISKECIISQNPEDYEAMPLILNEHSTWPKLNIITDYFKVEPGTKITFACPSHETDKNKFKMFPRLNKATVICDKQDIFTVKEKPYKLSDFECDHPVTPSVIYEKKQCAVGPTESLRVGYNTSTSNFLQTYHVCFDTSKNLPIYSLEWMPDSNNERNVEYNWYKHPAVEFSSNDNLYTCENSTSNCCYKKAQLISTRAFSDSVAQTSTFIDPINAVPAWVPCDEYESPWETIEKNIRSRLKRFPVSVIWSGTHIGDKQNGDDVPRYLFKMVEFHEETSIAIVYVNGPSPTEEDVLCENTFREDEVSWVVKNDHVYLCDERKFRKAFEFKYRKRTTVQQQSIMI